MTSLQLANCFMIRVASANGKAARHHTNVTAKVSENEYSRQCCQ